MSSLPSDPARDLAAAELARQRLAASLRLPSWFRTSLGVAIALQIGTAAYGLAGQSDRRMIVLLAGLALFLVVAGVQVVRFRRLNGVQVEGLVSRAVFGTSTRASLVHVTALAAAVWAGLADRPWLALVAALLGGAGYAVSAQLWWRDYQQDPARNARAESRTTLVLLGAAALTGLVVLVAVR